MARKKNTKIPHPSKISPEFLKVCNQIKARRMMRGDISKPPSIFDITRDFTKLPSFDKVVEEYLGDLNIPKEFRFKKDRSF